MVMNTLGYEHNNNRIFLITVITSNKNTLQKFMSKMSSNINYKW